MKPTASQYFENERIAADESADRSLAWYNMQHGVWSNIETSTVLSHLNPAPRDWVLDAGSGSGRMTLAIAPKVARVHAVDLSRNCLIELRREASSKGITNLSIANGNISKMVLPLVSFDSAVSVEVLQHIPTFTLRCAALINIRRALRPGGKLVLVVYRWGGGVISEKEGEHAGGRFFTSFTPEELWSMLVACGFRRIRIGGCVNTPERLYRIARYTSKLDVLASHLSASQLLGKYLIATARRPT